jgi:hypothetical protein
MMPLLINKMKLWNLYEILKSTYNCVLHTWNEINFEKEIHNYNIVIKKFTLEMLT